MPCFFSDQPYCPRHVATASPSIVIADSNRVVEASGDSQAMASADALLKHRMDISEFPIPTSNSQPMNITAGPDGNLWFTERAGNKIGRITTAGTITEFASVATAPDGITKGPDGNLWFAAQHAVGKVTPAGQVTLFGRVVGAASYRSTLGFKTDGTTTINLIKVDGGTTTTYVGTKALTGLTYAAGDQFNFRMQTLGTSPTTVRARVWKVGTTHTSDVPGSKFASTIALAPGPGGRLWVAWGDNIPRIRALRTGTDGLTLGAVRTPGTPRGHAAVQSLAIEGTRMRADIVLNVGVIVTLSYFGLGIVPPTPDWGAMMADGQQFLAGGYYGLTLYPAAAVVLTSLALSLIGDGLAHALRIER